MLGKRSTKKLVGILIALSIVAAPFGGVNKIVHAVPASDSRYIEGDNQFSVNLINTDVPGGANPGAVDFNGNGQYDDSEMLPLKGTEDFVLSNSAQKTKEDFMTILGVEGGVLRNNVVVIREDMEGYQKSYLRDESTGGYVYLKVKLGGAVAEGIKPNIEAAVKEYQKNASLLSQGKGEQIQLKDQETLATIIMNGLGMKDSNGQLVNKDFKLNITYTTGSKTSTKSVPIEDILMDPTTAKINKYANPFNAPKIVDGDGNIYLKVYGLPTGSEITSVEFSGTLSFPSDVKSSVAEAISEQSTINKKTGIVPYLDPLLTEAINIDNHNPLDPLTIKPTVSYFVDLSVSNKGEISTDGNGIIEYIGPLSEEDSSEGYEHSNIRPLEDGIVFYDALYDPENTVKRIQMKDKEGKLYDTKILKEGEKVGQMQSYAKLDDMVKDPQKNAAAYKDLLVEGLKPGTTYYFTELIVTFNSGDGDINRRFTNYDAISVNPVGIRTMGQSPTEESEGELLKSFELKGVTPTKAEFTISFNDPNKTIKDVRIDGDSIASSVYKPDDNQLTLFGLTPNTEHSGFELIVTLKDGQELGMTIDPFTTKKVTNAKEWIEGFYHIFFLRDGDPEGMAYWISKLSSQEISVNYFTSNIVNEPEYKEKNLDNAKYVERMYRSVTGRTSDADGLAWWVKTLEETIKELGDRTAAMQNISQRMLGEKETRDFLNSIGLKVE